MSLRDAITIVIPTYERPAYLARVNVYYADFDCEVVIYDGSAQPNLMSFASNIRYRHVPALSIGQRFALGSRECKTRYIVPMPDDDLMSQQGLIECVNYLDTHAEAVSVHGQMICFDTDKNNKVDLRLSTGAAYLQHIERPTSEEPFFSLQYALDPYHPFIWGVHRLDPYRAFWKIGMDWIGNLNLWEYFFMWFMAVEGKLQMLPIFLIARQRQQLRHGDTHQARQGLDRVLISLAESDHDTAKVITIIADKMRQKWEVEFQTAQFFLYGLLVSYVVKNQIGVLRRPMDSLSGRQRLVNRTLKAIDNLVARTNPYYVRTVDNWGAVYFTEKRKFPVYEPRYQADLKKMYDVIARYPAH